MLVMNMALALFLIGVLYLISSVVPWHPYEIDHLRTSPEMACTSSKQRVQVKQTLHPPVFPSTVWIRDLEVTASATWFDESGEELTALQEVRQVEGEGDLGSYGTETRTSGVVLESPPFPGEWRLATVYQVEGSPFFTYRTYQDVVVAENTVTVRRC